MADLQIKNIDPAIQERMRDLALQRGCSINEFALRALRYAVGLSSEHPGGQDRQDIATMRGVWNQSENQAFREAIEAFREVESGPTFESPDKSGK